MFDFTLAATEGAARAGTFRTPHGEVPTPVFMPVGTLGTVKGVSPEELEALGATVVLANTYHLYLRPGHELVRELGGLHAFMRWNGPILTDSGGYQVFSLAHINRIEDEGVTFQSHVDGSRHLFTPESVMEIQRALGADIVMAFDECPPGGASRAAAAEANRRTLAWLERCRVRFDALAHETVVPEQTLFPVLQGNVYEDLRRQHARDVQAAGDWRGYGIGGLSVGEEKPAMWRAVEVLHEELPSGVPRYLMGVGYPEDLLEAIARGCDMFDCVAPTRNARHGTAWTAHEGQVNLKGARFRAQRDPIDPDCDCYACRRFDRAYLRHLLIAGERFGHRLVSIHNLRFLVRLAEEARRRIGEGSFTGWKDDWLARYRAAGAPQHD
ncbi:MAG: tRNA guanosine(34) transglycosylase Tgt [Gemmatimonadetes bacterium]|nr:MAG: tRNA guanosine(34) transglycosylase Tgt [Gemmatimonadota bacterium]